MDANAQAAPAAAQANAGSNGENYGIGPFLNMPPPWSPHCGVKWIDWDRKVEIWEDLTSLPMNKRGLALSLVLGGQARRIADKVPLNIFKREGSPDAPEAETLEVGTNLPKINRRTTGITYLRKLIEARFGVEEQDKAIQVLLRLFSIRRRRGEDMHAWITRFELVRFC